MSDHPATPSAAGQQLLLAPKSLPKLSFTVQLGGLTLALDALRSLSSQWLISQLHSVEPQLALFARFCMFPSDPNLQMLGCGWISSTYQPLGQDVYERPTRLNDTGNFVQSSVDIWYVFESLC